MAKRTESRQPLPATESFIAFAEPERRERCLRILQGATGENGWAVLQRAFLDSVDEYLAVELGKPVEDNIETHEAGGQWRIAFPHLAARGGEALAERFRLTMEARRAFTDANYFHGYPDAAEVHHEIETFLYFQSPLYHSGGPGADAALESIVDLAHHTGNWAEGVPDWYDWRARGFRSSWLGTRQVRAAPPHDYQEANHFRFVEMALTAFLGTGDQRYLDLCENYADRWCGHIEALAATGEPIRCSILPPGAPAGEMGYGGARRDGAGVYKVFYSAVSANTAYDIASALMDIHRVTGRERCLDAARKVLDQFFANGFGDRPAARHSEGRWQDSRMVGDPSDAYIYFRMGQFAHFLGRACLKHDMATGQCAYGQRVLDWAAQINEEQHPCDQFAGSLMAAAHYYDGDPAWLARGYAMALRVAAVVEANDIYHQCNSMNRQGSRAMMAGLYMSITGAADPGTRGNLPVNRLRCRSAEGGLPREVALRVWRASATSDSFEAVNSADSPRAFTVSADAPDLVLALTEDAGGRELPQGRIELAPQSSLRGRVHWRSK